MNANTATEAVWRSSQKVLKVARKSSNTVPIKKATAKTATKAIPRSTQKVSKMAHQPRNTLPKSAVRSPATTKVVSRSSQEALKMARQLNSTVLTPKRNVAKFNVSQNTFYAIPKRQISCIVCRESLEAVPGMPKMRTIVCSYECSTFNDRE